MTNPNLLHAPPLPQKDANHAPRIKVSKSYKMKVDRNQMFSMTIADSPGVIGDTGEISPSDVRRVEDFIMRNKGLLLLTGTWRTGTLTQETS